MSIFLELGIRDGKDRIKEEVLYNLAACYALAEKKVTQVLAPYNLSPVKMNVLLMIKHVGKKEGLSQAEIGKRMIVSASNITHLIDRLENNKLVKRTALQGDRRVKVICITKNGSDLLDTVWPVYKKEVEGMISLMPELDIKTACVVLSGFREKLSERQEVE